MAFSSIVQIGCSAGLRSLGNGELLWRELTLNGAGHHRAEDLVVEEPDRDEVEPAATTVELDSRHDVKKPPHRCLGVPLQRSADGCHRYQSEPHHRRLWRR